MIYTKVHQDQEDGDEGYVYMFPKCIQVTEGAISGRPISGTLGETFIPNTDLIDEEGLLKLDRDEFNKMLDRNNLFFWGKP